MLHSIRDIARRAGGIPSLARRLGVSRQAIYQWTSVPLDKVEAVSEATGLSRSDLRPDVFGDDPAVDAGYERDYSAWALRNAALLREGRLELLDRRNLAEEIEDMARRERDEIESRLSVLIVHLLKWLAQPEGRNASWQATIYEQRMRIARRLKRSPSLQSYPAEAFAEEYADARHLAAIETRLPLHAFPESPPFSCEEALDPDYLPE